MEFKDKLRETIDYLDSPVIEVADVLGISQSTVYRWLKGTTKPPLNIQEEIIEELVAALNC